TACGLASVALSMLREKKDSFDIVISDVNMPHMDGFKLLEQVELETDLPVIMMSGNGETSAVMKGIEHGACDYLIKPVRIHELKNIWQHVIRKKRNNAMELEHSGGVEDIEGQKKGLEDANYSSSIKKKRKDPNEEEDHGDQENDDLSTLKKPRFIWTRDMHRQFEHAVNYLGIDKAVPKKILELLPVKGLTREIVASHLQKYRLSHKRSCGRGYPQGGLHYSFGVTAEANYVSNNAHGRFKVPAIIASGKMSPQNWAALQADLSGRSKMNNELQLTDKEFLVGAPIETIDCNPFSRLIFGNPLMNNQTNILQKFHNQIEMKKFSQIQPPMSSFDGVGTLMTSTSLGFNKNLQKTATVDVGSGTVGQICALNYTDSLNQHNNVFMMPEDLQLCVQLQSPQLQDTHALNLSPIDFLQPQLLSNDIRPFSGKANDSSCGNDVNGRSSSRRENRLPPVVCESNPLASVDFVEDGNHPDIDRNLDSSALSVENFSLSSTIGLSAPLSYIVRDFARNAPGLKSPSGNSETRTSQTGLNFCMSSGLHEKINQNGRPGWEVENSTEDPDLSQIVIPAQFQGYSQGSSGFDASNILDFQQGKVMNLLTKQWELPSRLASDAEPQSTVGSTQSQRDHNLVDNGLGFKDEDISDLIGDLQIDGGLLLDQFSPSYNIMDLILEQ
ncbi:hypothetical protein KI387_016947, partial [Taxus chinensis]